MGLKEILAAKGIAVPTKNLTKRTTPLKILPFPPVPSTKDEREDISYLSQGNKYLPPYKKDFYFIQVYSLLIRNPYLLYADFLPLRQYLLGDHVYVLNTFPLLNQERLFSLYMKHNPPQCAHDLHKLYVSLCGICLNVPGYYQEDVEEIIRKGEKLDKNSKMPENINSTPQ